jgi:CBS domain containing-hemolysin-like protein
VATLLIYLLIAVLLLALNAFFVLAEFAAVKIRPSRIETLIGEGHPRGKLLQHIHQHLDEYLSVCQVGITFASIGLGFVGEESVAGLLIAVTGWSSVTAHTVATAAAYVLVSFLHILLGELVPKSLAIRRGESSALRTAVPLKIFHAIFFVPLVILNGSANFILKLVGIAPAKEDDHSEEELRIILAKSQHAGLMSFRRLLLLENIFDLAEVKVRDAMRHRDAVKTLRVDAPWEENLKIVRESKLSRFPLVDGMGVPAGVIHVKDLFYAGGDAPDLRKLARPFVSAFEDAPLEALLGELQQSRVHLAVVKNAEGKWTGVISLEDIVEEITGTIEDEFETEPRIHLSDALTPARVVLDVEADSLEEAIGQTFGRIDNADLPRPKEKIVPAVLDRERAMSTYLGNGLAVPHARLEGLDKPAIVFARSTTGIRVKGREDKAHLLFILLTPAGQPRIQVRLLARVAAIVSSEYVGERLRQADSRGAVVEVVRAAEQVTLS